ncbi:Beta-glucosidase; 6-phospho-beta-glucosidase [Mesoplasma florum W37]|uniref:6-phospho-beta-glucosidase n=1 Tax=Mesoplasma florum TaxID=2151 RepID=A0AAD0MNA7_MESFO|nr:glycoside hydrolase family 1 protein [Mesoplasma florum]AGY41385.1 Beta-glucosidase; 6-phospho-beta-glucosidase [Mesoplasma florum W37]AVN59608.1 glycoside hydrolase family 1 protein [Mesoplasma florum]AVN65725.1 6-phospho-beta-glucosidase [Mesoplasma florum]
MKKILWGASSSAYQFEGGWNADGKGTSVQDVKEIINKTTSDFKVASDHYNKWKEDVKIMKEIGLTSYRFSISWTRIFPKGFGEINKKGIEFYSNLINELKANGIEPIITMFHFDMPSELEKNGGWLNKENIKHYVNYAKTLFDYLGDRVKYWITFNEQNVLLLQGPVVGIKRPDGCNVLKHIFEQNHNITLGQALIMQECHKRYGDKVLIGTAPNISQVYPNSNKPEDFIASQNINALRNWVYLDLITKGYYNGIIWNLLKKYNALFEFDSNDLEIFKNAKPDFIAFNYYTTATVQMTSEIENYEIGTQERLFGIPGFGEQVSNPNLEKTQFGWEIDPVGIKATIRELKDRYNLPLMITENGIGGYDEIDSNGKIDDSYRIKYMNDHIIQIKEALNENVDFIAYNCWSAFDLISVHEGIRKRYGLVFVDRTDEEVKECKRIRKESSYWYSNFIKEN